MHRFLDWLNFQKNERLLRLKKRQRDCVYDRSKRNRRYIKEWENEYMHGLLTTTKIMQCFALGLVVVGKIPPVRLESGEVMRSRPMKAGLVKSLAD